MWRSCGVWCLAATRRVPPGADWGATDADGADAGGVDAYCADTKAKSRLNATERRVWLSEKMEMLEQILERKR